MAHCTICGTALRPGAGFCTTCGAPVSSVAATCAGCGATLEPDARFCEVCGLPVAARPAAPAAANPPAAAPPAMTAAYVSGPAPTPGYAVSRPPAYAGAGAAGTQLPAHSPGMGAGAWLVVAGGVAATASSFVTWGMSTGYRMDFIGGSYWSGMFDAFRYSSWSSFKYVTLPQIGVILCIVAAVLALVHGLSGSGPGRTTVLWLGVVAVAILGVFDLVVWSLDRNWQYDWYPGVGFALGVGGAVLVIVGALSMPSAAQRWVVSPGQAPASYPPQYR